jgi:hypothetical protein
LELVLKAEVNYAQLVGGQRRAPVLPVRYGATPQLVRPVTQPDRNPGQLSDIAASPEGSDREAVVQLAERESDDGIGTETRGLHTQAVKQILPGRWRPPRRLSVTIARAVYRSFGLTATH